ncbi:WXG100-like domain-containing protein [Actinomadura montaniterrae]|jgi:hypothetical protein|uniref:Outer membrane channel protein CpnT-like N-terminal domain-containing protein n=1 Tax=Actinomadura montaniterrae TaxID=1803903 RepID=A0A6L3VHP2_9ACTN|nr:hypothetical protein [Actinomadura montaniterrae]KAB2369602.1 hypothetical protein F9B16_36700 [Actinomadura montaniterrae]
MGLQLPGELRSLLSMLGYSWPEADETKLMEMGGAWLRFAGTLGGPVADAHGHAQQVWTTHEADGVQAFRDSWTQGDAPHANLEDARTAAQIIGAGLLVCGGIVLGLKINTIVQLALLAAEIAQAIATAPETFGASLAEIPIFKEITGAIIDQLINLALDAILNG